MQCVHAPVTSKRSAQASSRAAAGSRHGPRAEGDVPARHQGRAVRNAGQPAKEDFKINGQYVNTPVINGQEGVVGIPFFDEYVEKASRQAQPAALVGNDPIRKSSILCRSSASSETLKNFFSAVL
jgi:hypothetical protein